MGDGEEREKKREQGGREKSEEGRGGGREGWRERERTSEKERVARKSEEGRERGARHSLHPKPNPPPPFHLPSTLSLLSHQLIQELTLFCRQYIRVAAPPLCPCSPPGTSVAQHARKRGGAVYGGVGLHLRGRGGWHGVGHEPVGDGLPLLRRAPRAVLPRAAPLGFGQDKRRAVLPRAAPAPRPSQTRMHAHHTLVQQPIDPTTKTHTRARRFTATAGMGLS